MRSGASALSRDDLSHARRAGQNRQRMIFGQCSECHAPDNPHQLLLGEAFSEDQAQLPDPEMQMITYQRGQANKVRPEDCVSDSGLRLDASMPVPMRAVVPARSSKPCLTKRSPAFCCRMVTRPTPAMSQKPKGWSTPNVGRIPAVSSSKPGTINPRQSMRAWSRSRACTSRLRDADRILNVCLIHSTDNSVAEGCHIYLTYCFIYVFPSLEGELHFMTFQEIMMDRSSFLREATSSN
jgi:hypothetical protein